jgi:hypothetical protein
VEVVRSLREHELLAENVNAEFDRQVTTGEGSPTALPNLAAVGPSSSVLV